MTDEWVEQLLEMMEKEGAVEPEYITRQVNEIYQELYSNDRHVLEAYMIIRALENIGQKTCMLEASSSDKIEPGIMDRFIREFSVEDHMDHNYKIKREG